MAKSVEELEREYHAALSAVTAAQDEVNRLMGTVGPITNRAVPGMSSDLAKAHERLAKAQADYEKKRDAYFKVK